MSNLNAIIARLLKTSTLGKLKYLPRWIVFMLDVMILFTALMTVRFILSETLLGDQLYQDHFLLFSFGVVVINILVFLYFQIFSGIIRHSSFIDGLKLFSSQSLVMVLLIMTKLIFEYGLNIKFLPFKFLLLFCIISFLYLFTYRVFVKIFFDQLANVESDSLLKAVILGTDANAIAVANALTLETPQRFKLIAFIDFYGNHSTKRILNLPIIGFQRRMSVLLRSLHADAVILTDSALSRDEKQKMIDDCLEYDFKFFVAPMVTDWSDSTDISKNIKKFEIQDLLERKEIVLDKKSIYQQIEGNTILVTGAAGSIGSEIARQVVLFNPKELIVLDQAESALHELHLELNALANKNVRVVPCLCDIRNIDALTKVFSDFHPAVVYHAAAYKHVPMMEEYPSQAIFTNVMGTKNVADLSCLYKATSFVMVSTDKAVNPSNIMGASKRIAECYIKFIHVNNADCKTKFITTRFGNVLGSNGSVVPLFTKQIEQGGPITITHPDIIRYFMTIPEACQLVLEAGAMGNGGEIFIFDMGEPVKILDLAKKMIRLAGLIPEKDIQINFVGLRPGEKLYEELLTESSKTLATHHKKIMIATEGIENIVNFAEQVNDLIVLAKSGDLNELVSKMKKMVPEYLSMNSKFELLDEKNR
jgi:FlaA1/EpsC-like NDP-sugar epimerase